MIHESWRRTLRQSPVYPLYRWAKDRYDFRRLEQKLQSWNQEDELRLAFYAQLFEPDSLVFDVGANVGNRSKVFLRAGARVVAFEPQDKCAALLKRTLGRDPRFSLERAALGKAIGETEMMISQAHTISSLSTEWIRAVQQSGRFAGYSWGKKQKVELDTLDNMVRKHGEPVFVKIDVEGYELEVLLGLTKPVRLVSIEFTPELIETTLACIAHLATLSPIECQVSLGESMHFELGSWVSQEGIVEYLRSVEPMAFGDVYIRSKLS